MKNFFCLLIAMFPLLNLFSQSNKLLSIYGQGGANFLKSDYNTTLVGYNGGGGILLYLTSSQSVDFGIIGNYNYYLFQGRDNSGKGYGYFRTKSHLLSSGLFFNFYLTQKSSLRFRFNSGILFFDPLDGSYDPLPNNRNGVYNKSIFTVAPSLDYNIYLSDNFSLDFSFEYVQPFTDYLDDIELWKWDYGLSTKLGISIYFTSVQDADEDGIIDKYDKCPNEKEDFNGYK